MTTKIEFEFPNEEIAKKFASFIQGFGASTFYEWLDEGGEGNPENFGRFQETYGNLKLPIVYKLSE